MATVNSTRPKQERVFIGRGWLNTIKTGDNAGKQFISLKLDNGMNVTLGENDRIDLFPNVKREGKQDADFRASILVEAAG